jgi:hypothetical protein
MIKYFICTRALSLPLVKPINLTYCIIPASSNPIDVSAEGIFRISGSKKRQDELKHLLDKDVDVDFEKDGFTEHDVASVLKVFLAELPESIITTAHIKVHMQISGKPCVRFLADSH